MSSVTGQAHGSDPCHSPARSAPENAATTPSAALVFAVSTPAIRACAYGLRKRYTCTIPGTARSSMKRACPVRRRASSLRGTDVPIVAVRSSVAAITDPLRRRGGLDRLDDVVVARTAAEVALEPVADLRLARVRVLGQQADGGQHHPWRAVAALEPVLLVEGLLHRMQLAVRGESFDRRQLLPVRLDCEQRAGLHGLAVQEDRAGAAGGRVAPDVRPRQPELLAQEVDEQLSRL